MFFHKKNAKNSILTYYIQFDRKCLQNRFYHIISDFLAFLEQNIGSTLKKNIN